MDMLSAGTSSQPNGFRVQNRAYPSREVLLLSRAFNSGGEFNECVINLATLGTELKSVPRVHTVGCVEEGGTVVVMSPLEEAVSRSTTLS